MKNKKILLVGEYCTDKYIEGKILRMSPEAPVPVFEPIREYELSEMAGNVYEQFKSLSKNMDIDYMFFDVGIKLRYIEKESGQQVLRVDTYNDNKKDMELFELNKYDGIIISDYGKGYINDDIIKYLINDKTTAKIFVDTKRKNLKIFQDATIKLNQKEAEKVTDYHTGKLLVTLGSEGISHNEIIYPVDKVLVKDVTGAGDTFLATLCIYSVNGYSFENCIKIANIAASLSVSKPQTNTVSYSELEEKISEVLK